MSTLEPSSVLWQDLRMGGDDIKDFVSDLADKFGDQDWAWPWSRFVELNEPSLISVLTLVRQFWAKLRQREGTARNDFERLELGHIAAVIESGHWRDP